MLRVQRRCGKSRGGASVPLCIKIQGAVLCGKAQHQENEIGCTCLTDSFERSDSQDKQACSPLASPVCKTEASHSENCERPHGKEPSSGKLFSLILRLSCHLWRGLRVIKTLNIILRKLEHNPLCCSFPTQTSCRQREDRFFLKVASWWKRNQNLK